MKYISVILFFAFIIISCEKCRTPADTEWKEGVVYNTGEIALDGCGWLLLSDGSSYHMKNFDEEFMVDGLDVWFKAKNLDDTFYCGLGQSEYQVKEIIEMKEKPFEARFLNDYPDRELSLDGFSMDSVHIDGDSLRLHVGYSGGCAFHQFNLWIMETGIDSNGDPHLLLEHIGNGDPCEAYPWEWLSFSLEPLRTLGHNKVVFWLRGSPQMSMLFGPYTYEF